MTYACDVADYTFIIVVVYLVRRLISATFLLRPLDVLTMENQCPISSLMCPFNSLLIIIPLLLLLHNIYLIVLTLLFKTFNTLHTMYIEFLLKCCACKLVIVLPFVLIQRFLN